MGAVHQTLFLIQDLHDECVCLEPYVIGGVGIFDLVRGFGNEMGSVMRIDASIDGNNGQ